MSNSVIVYWSVDSDQWMRAKEPQSVYNDFLLKNYENKELYKCPAFKDYMKNMYGIKSMYSYDFSINGNDISTTKYGEHFFHKHVVVRSIKDRNFSFDQKSIFFTEEKSLKLSVGIQPFFEQNEVSKRCMNIPGTLDIGKWFRNIDYAFYLRNEYNDFVIKEDDIYQYIQFYTDKKIIFKQFYFTEYLRQQHNSVGNARAFRPEKFRKLEEYYSIFKNKDRIIKEIKNNLVL